MTVDPAPRAGRREWTALAVLALPTMVVSMNNSVLNLALPHLSAQLQPSSAQLLWIVDVYGFLVAGLMITMGTLGDRVGRRRLLLIGAAFFALAAAVAALATSAPLLIAARALLGLAGGSLMPSTLALLRTMFADASQRAVAIGVWTTTLMAGVPLGGLLGGVLLQYFWWGSVFVVSVPPMLLLLALGPVLLPEARDERAGRLDLTSVALSLAAVLPVVYGIKQAAQNGPRTAPVAAALAGLVMGVLFLRRQGRLTDPLLDLSLFRARTFTTALTTMALTVFAMSGIQFFAGQYLQTVEGLSPLTAGLWMVPAACGGVTGSLLAPHLARRFRPGSVIAAGLALAVLGLLSITRLDSDAGLLTLIPGQVLMALGSAPVMALGTAMVIGSAPPARAGSAAATAATSTELGVALGVAVLGSAGSAVYRAGVKDTLPPGLSAPDTDAIGATIGGAARTAGHLPAPAGAEVLEAARSAFVHAVQVNAVIGAVLTAALTALVLGFLRGPRPGTGDTAPPATRPGDTPARQAAP